MKLGLLALALLAVCGTASAAQNMWEIDTDFRTGVELGATQVYPDHPIPAGATFRISLNAWTDINAIDEVAMSELEVVGCRIISQQTDQQADILDLAIVGTALIEQGPDSCTWIRRAYVNDTVQGNIAEIAATGTLPAYTMHDAGQDPNGPDSAFLLLGVVAVAVGLVLAGGSPARVLAASVLLVAASVGLILTAGDGFRLLAVGALLYGLLAAWEYFVDNPLWKDGD